MQTFKKIFWCLNILLVIFTLLVYISPFINPKEIWQFSLFGLFYPFALISNLVFLLFWALQKDKSAFLSLFCILLGFNYIFSFFSVNFSTSKKGITPTKVISYNIGSKKKHIQKGFKKAFEEFLLREDPTIFATQEYPSIEFYDRIPAYKHRVRKGTACLISKTPFLDSGGGVFPNSRNNAYAWADTKIKNKTYRFYSIHFQSLSITGYTEKFKPEDIQQKETLIDIKTITERFVKAAQRRADQVKLIKKEIESSPYPVVVCGDFNAPPVSYSYREMTENLTDNFKEKANGFGFTYSGKIPGLRIDYILTDEQIKVIDHYILKDSLSDHYPIVSILDF